VAWMLADRYSPDLPARARLLGLVFIAAASALLAGLIQRGETTEAAQPRSGQFASLVKPAVAAALGCLLPTVVFQVRSAAKDFEFFVAPGLRECARALAPRIPPQALVLASGGHCRDRTGYPAAYNTPHMFYWMDRKGFNLCVEEQALDAVWSFAKRGAQFYLAEKGALGTRPRYEQDLRRVFPVLAECGGMLLFRLSPR